MSARATKDRMVEKAKARGDEAAIRFVLALAESLHRYGTPADRLEENLALCSARLGLSAQFFASPTSILASFETRRGVVSRMLRVAESELNLEKLVRVDRVISRLVRGEIGPDEARIGLEEVERAPDRFGPAMRVAGFAAAATLVARLFGGGAAELLLTLLTASVIGVTVHLLAASDRMRPLAVAVAAGLASASGFAFLGPVDEAAAYVVTVSSLILLMPGLKVTIAMRELAMQHLTSGTTRMMAALRTLLGMAFGVIGGRQAAAALPSPPDFLPGFELPEATLWAAVALFPIALVVDFRARWRDLPVIAAGCFSAYFAASWGRSVFGPEMGAFVGSLAVGVAGNLFARVFDRPASVLQIPGVTLLVPGSVGFRSVFQLLDHDAASGVDAAFRMVLVGTALGSGLIVANVLVPPRRAL
ncbi:MAG: threonine/serine exporter family protein [Planctomycetota bacterium]